MPIHKSQFSKCLLAMAIILTVGLPTSHAQNGGMGMSGMGMGGGMGGMGMGYEPSPLDKLKQSLKRAKTEGARQSALTKIEAILSSQYDAFLIRNESELQEMEGRVRKLRAQLERRKKAKSQLLDLELQRIANEASGLVWPEQPPASMGMGGMGMGGMGIDGMGAGGMGMMGGMPAMPGMGEASGGGSGMESFDDSHGDESELPAEDEDGSFEDSDKVSTDIMNQLRQIILAIHNFDSANRHLPKNITDEEGKPLLSWRVAILQFMDEPERKLYKRFKLDERWNSPHNIKLLEEMPDVYKCPILDSNTKTAYLGFQGDGTIFEPGKKLSFSDITDGTSNTLCVAQVNQFAAVEWTKPADVKFDPGTGTQLAVVDGTVTFGLVDGSVRKIAAKKLTASVRTSLIQRNDGQIVDLP
ncbi:DUF1559 family PulG-like putative transporter [Mariniblastus fucicola]|uniref:DUF1559 domain-containing protein n=1 Tax=Mariniblastus fucicola TaxID=980251 RepID=A0A5B9P8C2_9BACT|nr:DUF1559 domain-containing protein [Mariniblastus fucicola]QEG22538.1 hypothetical protein MFFC18_24190 [Mariniblastus fucicola]